MLPADLDTRAAQIPNDNMPTAFALAVAHFWMGCENRGLALDFSNVNYWTGELREMRINVRTIALLFVALAGYAVGYGQAGSQATAQDKAKKVKRVGMVIGIRPEKIEEYKALHADSNAGVRDLLTTAHMKNFSIFMHQLDDGKYYLFGYYEYDGDDFEADMAALDAKDRNKAWLKMCDPMQLPLTGQVGWSEMEQAYYNK